MNTMMTFRVDSKLREEFRQAAEQCNETQSVTLRKFMAGFVKWVADGKLNGEASK